MKPVKAVTAARHSTTLRTVEELCDHALVPRERMPALAEVAARYAVAITPAIAGLIDPSDPHDPIAKQFVPDARELAARPQERGDPIGDDAFSPVEGVVHRYPDRVLLKLVNACAVYCRFCFRREMVGPGRGGLSAARSRPRSTTSAAARRSGRSFSAAATRWSSRRAGSRMRRAARRDRAREGDPRAHARPGRGAGTDHGRAGARAAYAGKATYVVLHANHPRELTRTSARGVRALRRCRHADAEPVGAAARRER